MTKTLAIDSWSTLIQSHKLHIYVNDLQVPITFHFPSLTDKHASSIIISTDMYKKTISHIQISIKAIPTFSTDMYINNIHR